MAIENPEATPNCVVRNNKPPLLRYALRNVSRLLLVTLFAITGGSNTSAGVRYPLVESNNPPLTTPLLSGTSDELGEEFCRQIGLPHLVRTSPSSFICDELGIPVAEKEAISESSPKPSSAPPELPREEILPLYIVKPGDTFSQIIEQQFGYNEAYGIHFRETLFQNEGWLTRKSPVVQKAIVELRLHPDWTPRIDQEAWRLFMQATRNINPGDIVMFKNDQAPKQPEKVTKEEDKKEEVPEIGQSSDGFFGSGICTEPWLAQPTGNEVCAAKPPFSQCVQLGSGETPSFKCTNPQIAGRVEGDMTELEKYHLVIDRCPEIPGLCTDHLEINSK